MAVVNILRKFTGEELTGDYDGQGGKTGFVDNYTALTAATDSALDVQDDPACPKLGDVHSSGNMFVTNIRIRRTSQILFEIAVTYGVDSSEASGSPLNKPWDIRWGGIDSDEPIDCDVNGQPIMTVNGEPFDPPLIRRWSDTTLTVVRNQVFYDEFFYSQFRNAVNSSNFGPLPAGTVQCVSIEGVRVLTATYEYWEVTFQYEIRRGIFTSDAKAFWKRVRAEGYYVWESSVAKIVRARELTAGGQYDPAGEIMAVPVLHDTTTGARITVTPGQQPVAQWYEFQVYHSRDLNALGIP